MNEAENLQTVILPTQQNLQLTKRQLENYIHKSTQSTITQTNSRKHVPSKTHIQTDDDSPIENTDLINTLITDEEKNHKK